MTSVELKTMMEEWKATAQKLKDMKKIDRKQYDLLSKKNKEFKMEINKLMEAAAEEKKAAKKRHLDDEEELPQPKKITKKMKQVVEDKKKG